MRFELGRGDILMMIIYHTGGMTCEQIGKKLGVSKVLIYKELKGRGYKPFIKEKPKPEKHWLFREV